MSVLGGAPYGYRYITVAEGGGQARYEICEDEAPVVRQVFTWVGRERVSIGEVCRRLKSAGVCTRCGKTRVGPLQPRLRAQRGHPLQSRRATSSYDVPAAEWLLIAVPAVVSIVLTVLPRMAQTLILFHM